MSAPVRRPRPLALLAAGSLIVLTLFTAYTLWTPSVQVHDGRHDLGRNGVWLAHGWLGGDSWFLRNHKEREFAKYRAPESLAALKARLAKAHVTDVFPHLCPPEPEGALPEVDGDATEHFLDALEGLRVLPWIGGPNDGRFEYRNPRWTARYLTSVHSLLEAHPRLAGVHVNVEPMTSGDRAFLAFLDQLRAVLPAGKILSVAAYPPPTMFQNTLEVHWEEPYFREVARRADQLVPMMYDTSLRSQKQYVWLMSTWTREELAWSEGKPVLLGVPAYDDPGVGYHVPDVENLGNALLGIHSALSDGPLPPNYQGIAIYSD